jgi:hypothetical protein
MQASLDVTWQEHPGNPIIRPPGRGWMIADPTVLLPQETPDGRWHLWANSIPPRLHHFVSADGTDWRHKSTFCKGAMRPYVRRFGGDYHLFYEKVTWWLPLRSRIVTCRSTDLESWSSPTVVLEPSQPWHGSIHRTVGNPCVVPWRDEFLLFYSAGTVFLRDCGFVEPRCVGLARAQSLRRPWVPEPDPILGPDPDDPLRNLGAGSIKVLPDPANDTLWGFNNGIYRDATGRSRSAIALIQSSDGLTWAGLARPPFLAPEGTGWKRALVYALDVRQTGPDQWHLYFNARDGWFRGKEQIGLAVGRRKDH